MSNTSENDKLKILRIGTFPTVEESGRGLHAYELSKVPELDVLYLTYFRKKKMEIFETPKNVDLHVGGFITTPFPKNKNIFIKLFFSIFRISKLFCFSFHALYLILSRNVDIVHIHSPMFSFVSVISKIFGRTNFITFQVQID